jgi:ribose transport system substrate-binding protein
MKKYTRPSTLIAALCVGVLAFAGCSAKADTDSGPSDKKAATNTSGLENTSGDVMLKNIEENTGVEGAKKLVQMWTSAPTSVGVTEPIKGEIPTGKKIAFMNCGVEICIANGNAVKEAAGLLGWTVELINVGATPDDINASWNRVAAGDYDGVIASGLPSALFADALKKLTAKKVPVVECCVTADSSAGITALVGDSTTVPTGQQYAAWVAADTDGKANALWVGSADFPVIAQLEDSFNDGMKSWCPDCKTSTLNIPAAEIGTTMPTKIASYVKSHPDINYIALGYDGFATGLTQALTDAGVADKVKFIGDDALPSNKQAVVDGTQAASIAFPIYEEMYAAVDALARTYAGESVEPSQAMMPMYIYTQDNMVDPSKFEPLVADYQDQFKKLWGK